MLKMKKSEARILVFLSNVSNPDKFVTNISRKLGMDYAYLIRILGDMVAKGWLRKHHLEQKVFYDLYSTSPIETAKKILMEVKKN